MNATLPRLLWKEYRTHRSLFVILVVTGLALQLFLYSIKVTPALSVVAFLFPAFFALGAAGTSFALEKEEGTDDFLRMLAVPAGRLFLGKIGICIVGTLLMLLPLIALAVLLTVASASHRQSGAFFEWSMFAMTLAMSFIVCGILCSLLFSKALNAVWAAAVLGGMAGWLLGATQLPSISMAGKSEFHFVPFLTAVSLSAVILGIDYWLTTLWLGGRSRLRSAMLAWTERTETADEHVIRRETAPPWRRQARRLLWEEARHAMPFVVVYFAAAALLLIPGESAGVPGSRPRAGWFAFLVITVTPVLMGVWAFRGEQHRSRFRFLAERGVAPSVVWLSKHAIWLPLAMMTMVLLIGLAPIISRPFWNALVLGGGLESYTAAMTRLLEQLAFTFERQPQFSTAELMGNLVLLVCVGYGIGQAASMLFPRAVTAAFLAVLIFTAVVVHIALMRVFHVPLLLSVVPIAAIALLASLVRAPDWLIERNRPRAWLKVVAVVLIPTLLMLVEVACYRVYEIPARDPGFDVAAFKQPPSQSARGTADLYRRAVAILRHPEQEVGAMPAGPSPLDEDALLDMTDDPGLGAATAAEGGAPSTSPESGFMESMLGSSDDPSGERSMETDDEPRPSVPSKTISDGWEFATPTERQFVEMNADALELIMQASQRPECHFWNPADPTASAAVDAEQLVTLLDLLLHSARQLESQGDFETAQSRYVAGLRMARHVADGPFYWFAIELRNRVYAWLPGWAAHSEQDSRLVRDFLNSLYKLDKDFPSAARAVKAEYLHAEHWIANPELPEDSISGSTSNRIFTNLVHRWMPWELARGDRVLNLVTRQHLNSVGALETALARRDDLVNRGFQTMEVLGERPTEWLTTTPSLMIHGSLDSGRLLKQVVNSETHRRAALTILGLLAWRHEYGELPDHLDQLIGTVPDSALVDPWSGNLFGYRPLGFSAPVPFGTHPVDAKQPVLWSVGAGNARIAPTGQINAEGVRYQIVVDPQVNSGLNDQDLGIAYPIPRDQ